MEQRREAMDAVAARAVRWEPGMEFDVLYDEARQLVTGRAALHAAVWSKTTERLRAAWAPGVTRWRDPY